ncbi:glycosyltransferase family 1 protein [Streptomyces olivaceus]|uniref:glycosyltransferase family 4 protein n=1 Tax=Streptomyces olivaceus TaxID=47716 RepID=UPI001CCAEF24|nr:glycosyltransferase family 1 protein [Streptomyces olivaceus]MBZ6194827.1 glycosyltransferase family 1 protein [Streptomyces olivaceus]MBZ6290477.1 glycosyltransferase family 1 protein [Streptomyces olivaceus]MBZ6306331.1 glycosyltransferase family 1 protein [Streptomyces olivaceus]MBZ6319887.1 glycosyltransferase family 1 protein [Streptomyces olivaceus]MBZ6324429.1 glycosyltransferase family 1 protein [Streptomyces olivaceus]
MRVVIVTESFPPDVNGVAHCALQTARHLTDRGHDCLVVAPATAAGGPADASAPCPVVRVPSLPLPGYPQVRVALPSRRVAAAIAEHRADVVHLASPFVLGVRGMAAAARLGVPAVAVYQTDLAGYARTYMGAGEAAAWRRIRSVHSAAELTLAPSSAALRDLRAHGVPRVELWPRGVETVRFRPGRRDEALRRELAPNGELIVGYVGRLAPEKQVELLSGACALDGVRVVVVGDGPSRPGLEAALPGAVFLGRRTGDDLARVFASLDVFAHTGPFETFCQTVQEAMASGVPVVAPAAGGPLDLVAHGRTGLLVPPRDADAVRDAVWSLTADPALRAAYGAAGRAAVEQRTWAAVGDRLIGHYTDVLAARKAVLAA